ncbi:ANK REP REGION domain-containing protein [Citrus sinensis]|uniref:ANK REP REGION domain-containing protein n=2 Tax=Citrus sinensis TaxID=2711 RepID=A0ACB8I5B2_CITSI|nr:ANK REP REGION domain-containing protein [Citrus sinensis]KAH9682255.1 ANK REP REGION domain-containing protein [Citrus sinensis]
MNSDLYKAAAKGEIEQFEKLPRGELGSIVTHKENTILHVNIIAAQTQEGESVSTKFVERILEMCPSLLLQVNAKGDAPLHAAAKCGHAAVVEALIEFAKKQPHQELESGVGSTARHMLGMKNDEEDTALHEAVQSGRFDVVKILLGADPAFPYSANGSGETPLYLAAARGHKKISAEILQKCPLAAHEGPNGKTALHAAVCSGSRGVIELLLDRKKSLTRERDQHGWTPLHYAAYIDRLDLFGFLILEADKSAALIPNEDRKMTALHLAAGQGNVWIVREIIECCPECCELVDDRGWNVLHFAMVSFDKSELKYLVDKYPMVRNLIFEKDEKGNTPFHVLAAVCPHLYNAGYGIVPWKIAKGYYQAVNKQNISVEHINRYGFPELEKEIKELAKADGNGQYQVGVIKMNKEKEEKTVIYSYWKDLDEDVIGMEKASEYHLVVAALIATVTFAAAFTLPGGYKSDTEDGPNRGTAILSKNAAFQAFVISDAIAMVLSLSAVFVHFILSLKLFKRFIFLFVFALSFTLVAMAAMIVAFVTGTYAVLAPSLGLAIVTCIIGLTFFFLVIFMFYMVISKAKEEEFED